MGDPTADALRNALADFADALDPAIERLPVGSTARDRLNKAQTDLENAAVDIAAKQIEQIVQKSADLATIASVTARIEAKGDEIAAREGNVERVVSIATEAVSFAAALGSGNVGGVVAAAEHLRDAVS